MEEEQKIKIKAVVEIAGSPKEHVEETMKKVLEKVKENFDVTNEILYDAEKVNEFWSTFVDIEIEMKDMDKLLEFSFDFMPSSIEILEPSKFNINSSEIEDMLNDLLAKLHQYDMIIKNLNAQVQLMEMEEGKK